MVKIVFILIFFEINKADEYKIMGNPKIVVTSIKIKKYACRSKRKRDLVIQAILIFQFQSADRGGHGRFCLFSPFPLPSREERARDNFFSRYS